MTCSSRFHLRHQYINSEYSVFGHIAWKSHTVHHNKEFLRMNKEGDIPPVLNKSGQMRSKWSNWQRKVYIKTDIVKSVSLSFWELENSFVKIYLQVCCRSQRNAWQKVWDCRSGEDLWCDVLGYGIVWPRKRLPTIFVVYLLILSRLQRF